MNTFGHWKHLRSHLLTRAMLATLWTIFLLRIYEAIDGLCITVAHCITATAKYSVSDTPAFELFFAFFGPFNYISHVKRSTFFEGANPRLRDFTEAGVAAAVTTVKFSKSRTFSKKKKGRFAPRRRL